MQGQGIFMNLKERAKQLKIDIPAVFKLGKQRR